MVFIVVLGFCYVVMVVLIVFLLFFRVFGVRKGSPLYDAEKVTNLYGFVIQNVNRDSAELWRPENLVGIRPVKSRCSVRTGPNS